MLLQSLVCRRPPALFLSFLWEGGLHEVTEPVNNCPQDCSFPHGPITHLAIPILPFRVAQAGAKLEGLMVLPPEQVLLSEAGTG